MKELGGDDNFMFALRTSLCYSLGDVPWSKFWNSLNSGFWNSFGDSFWIIIRNNLKTGSR